VNTFKAIQRNIARTLSQSVAFDTCWCVPWRRAWSTSFYSAGKGNEIRVATRNPVGFGENMQKKSGQPKVKCNCEGKGLVKLGDKKMKWCGGTGLSRDACFQG